MGAGIALRGDFDGPGLRRLAKATKDAGQSRRLVALAEIYDGGARSDAARMSGVGLQVIRDWVLRFNADGLEGLIDRKATGPGAQAQRRATPGTCTGGRERADPRDPWRRALASEGPRRVDMGGVPHRAGRDNREPGAEGTGVRQDFRASASSCAERAGHRRF